MAISFFANPPLGQRPTIVTQSSLGTLETVTGLTASHKVYGPTVETTLTLASVAQPVANGVEYQYNKLWTFPQGRILIFDTVISLTQTTTSALATTLNASSTGALAVGSAAASSTTLSTTMANYLPSTAFVSSATVNVAGTTVTAELDANGDYSELVNLDGSTTANPVYFNSAYATTTDVDGDATQTWSGTIKLYWMLATYTQGVN